MLTLDLWLCWTGPNRRSARYNRDELAPSHRLLQKGPTALFSTLATKGIELANHRGFFEAGKRLLKRARFARQPMALIMFDLDRFKSINDRYGHHTGDEVLTAFCRLASSQLRPNDLFGRIGGEEFASLLPDTGHHDAVWRSERVRSAFETSSHTFWTTWIRLNRQRRDCDYGPAALISARSLMRLIKRSIAPRCWVAIVRSRRRIGPKSGRPNSAPSQSNSGRLQENSPAFWWGSGP